MAELHPIMPSADPNTGALVVSPQDAPEAAPITEQEVGEYREQDRFLPVRHYSLFLLDSFVVTSENWTIRSQMSQES